MSFHDEILVIATSQDWVLLGINLLLSTVIGGIVIIVLMAIASKVFRENINLPNAFAMVFLINLITIFGVAGLLAPSLPGTVILALPVLIWILLTKVFFSGLSWKHALPVGLIGYVLSIFLIPNLVVWGAGFFPSF